MTMSISLLKALLWWFPERNEAEQVCETLADKINTAFRSSAVQSVGPVEVGRGWGIALALAHPNLCTAPGQHLELSGVGTGVSRGYTRDWRLALVKGGVYAPEIIISGATVDLLTQEGVLITRQDSWKHFPDKPLLDLRGLTITMEGDATEPRRLKSLTFHDKGTGHTVTLPDLLIETLLRGRYNRPRGQLFYEF